MTIVAAGVAGRAGEGGGGRAFPGIAAEDPVVAPARAGGTERLAALFERHHARLFRLACRLTADREEARDLVQETFLRAARRADSVPEGAASGEAWLVRTLVNLCRDHHRRLSVRSRARGLLTAAALAASAASAACAAPGPEAMVVAQATVRAALARLPARRRAVVVLHEIEELPVAGIARLLGIAAVTVRWHLLAARRELAAALLPPRAAAALSLPEEGGNSR
jgi:RNA polymerase sigma-70 factor (ECF subfamily)